MITILFYLLKVVLCSALLYTYYWFVLRNKQFHQYNRFYLMGISVFSWLVPFIKIDIIKEQVVAAPKVLNFVDLIADKNSSIEQEVIVKNSQFTWDNMVLIIAISISLLLIIKFIKSLWNVRKLIKAYPMKKLANLYLVMTDVKGTPFSFFKYIFWNTSIDLNGEVGKKILAHEVAHIEENHSFDKLLIELQLIIGWFNPITWLIRNELYMIHEFIADQKSIQNNDTSVLAELLLASAYPSQQHILSNSFFFSPIKRRIQMFTKTNTKYSYLRRLTILPIMAATVLLFAFRNGNLDSKPIIKLDKQYTKVTYADHGGKDLGASAADGTNVIQEKVLNELQNKDQQPKKQNNNLITKGNSRFLMNNQTKKQGELNKVVVVSYKGDTSFDLPGKQFMTVMIPPVFSNVENGWEKYLERTLDRDLLKRKKAPTGRYFVKVNFDIDQQGKVVNVKAFNDPGYGTSQEAVRIIESSPTWTPAIQNGSKVKYSLSQIVEFVLAEKK